MKFLFFVFDFIPDGLTFVFHIVLGTVIPRTVFAFTLDCLKLVHISYNLGYVV
jgi:hypothetical protein